MTDFSTPLPLYAPVHIFDDLPAIPPVTYVLNGWPISQTKKLTTFEYRIHWNINIPINSLTLSWRRPLSYRNQSIDFQIKSMDWFLYDNGLSLERVKSHNCPKIFQLISVTLSHINSIIIVHFKSMLFKFPSC